VHSICLEDLDLAREQVRGGDVGRPLDRAARASEEAPTTKEAVSGSSDGNSDENGEFAWVVNPGGKKVELWEPASRAH
jgi:hypothetical protein